MAERAPAWMAKHSCTSCETGYGFCAQWLSVSMKCCPECDHPGRWAENPWTADEVVEMWEGQEMPEMVKRSLARLRAEELA